MKGTNLDIVFVPGVWDLLHYGHVKFLERASKFGDVIIVGVEDDELVKEEKGRYPIISLKNRILALEALKYVDIAVPFYDFDYKDIIEQYNISIFILSETNRYNKEIRFVDAYNYISKIGKVIYLPYNHDISTSIIRDNVVNNVTNTWKDIWEKVGSSNVSDIIVGSDVYNEDKIEKLSRYITSKLDILPNDKVLDFGCGAGLILKNIKCKRFGIDIAEGMDGIFLVGDNIPFRNRFDHIICYGVIYYMNSFQTIDNILEKMKILSDSILIMEIPDVYKKELREKNRDMLGKSKYPKQLYFDRKFFEDRGFKTFDNEISVTNHSDYGFTAVYKL